MDKTKYKQVTIPMDTYNKLKLLNKKTINKAIISLFNEQTNEGIKQQIKQLQNDISEIQGFIERLVQANKLKQY